MKHVVLYVGHMYKPFWTKKIWPGRQEGPGKVKIWHIWVISMGNVHKCIILTFPDPPCQPGQILLVQNGLYMCPHIVLHVSCWNRTSGGYFRPSEVRFRAKIPLSSHWFYNVKTQKTHFLKIPEWADFDLLESNCRHIFLHKNQKIYHSGFFFSWYIFSSHVS